MGKFNGRENNHNANTISRAKESIHFLFRKVNVGGFKAGAVG